MTWPTPLISFDLETTGVDLEAARIVTAAIVTYLPGHGHSTRTWLSDVGGIEIPAAASDIHGITTDRARAEGKPAAEVVEEIAATLAEAIGRERPIVIMNARFDLTILDRECRRHHLATLTDRVGRPIAPVIDPLVIDKQVDRYRRGSRKLEALAAHYGVKLTDAHSADADAVAAADVVVKLAEKFPGGFEDLNELHRVQTVWAADQATSFRAYRKGRGEPTDGIVDAWPLVPYVEPKPAPHRPRRGDAVEAWLKSQRDEQRDQYGATPIWWALDELLDRYRLHADTGTPLGGHACEAKAVGDCDCLERPTP